MTDTDDQVHSAEFEQLPGHTELWIDTRIPGHSRTLYNLIGTHVSEDPEAEAGIPPEDFNIAIVEAPPGNGAAYHDHETVEVFLPLSGRWEIYYGEDSEELEGKEQVILEQWDAIQIPAGVFRGFRNAGDKEAHLLAITGGEDPGRVTWPDGIVEAAEEHGLARDEDGNLIDVS
jgi:mannose-6-phosphate isomerase-like protein (cupin superfamily)